MEFSSKIKYTQKICVECFTKPICKKICPNCHKKADKYEELTATIKIIDLLLFKKQVFAHFLINRNRRPIDYLRPIILLAFSIYFPWIFQLELSKLKIDSASTKDITEVDFFYNTHIPQIIGVFLYFLFLTIFFRSISFYNLFYSVIFSSFYSYFKIAFSLWNYSKIQYFIIAEFLSCVGNITGIGCFEEDNGRVITGVVVAKFMSISIVILLYNLY